MEDLISRQAAIDALGERPVVWSDNDDYTLGERNQYDLDRLAIETVPSAQPKRGKWNRLDMDTLNCNKCGATFVLNQGSEKMHFCPNCGADMRGEGVTE